MLPDTKSTAMNKKHLLIVFLGGKCRCYNGIGCSIGTRLVGCCGGTVIA